MTILTQLDLPKSPRLRILFLVSSLGAGGAERVATLLCRHWIDQGHDVTLMPTYSQRGPCAYDLQDRIPVDYLADRFKRPVGSPPGPIVRLTTLRRAIRELAPDVIVSFLTNVNVAALVATVGIGVPVVISERTYPPRQKLSAFWRIMRWLTYWRAATVVAQTTKTAEWLRQSCPGIVTMVIPNPVDVPIPDSEPRIDPAELISPSRRTILAVGRFVPEKGFDRLVAAFSQVASRLPDCDLVILGDGPERKRLEECCEDLDVKNRVFFPGFVGNVGSWYDVASVFVLSSRLEGFPNALLEAMAHGVPAVSVDCPTGPSDIIRNGIDGILVPENDCGTGLASAIYRVLHDENERLSMGVRAQDVTTRFSPETVVHSWHTLLNSAIA